MKARKVLFSGFEAGVFLSFLGCYLSVSLIGLGTTLVLLFGVLLAAAQRNRGFLLNNPLFVPMVVLIGAILISIALAEPYDFEKPIGKTRYLICFFFFTWYFSQKPQAKKWVLRLSQWLAVLLGVTAVLQFTGVFSPLPLFGSHPPSPLPYGEGRFFLASGFSFHHSPFACTLIMLSHVLLAHWLLAHDSRRHTHYGLPFLFCMVGVFCSFSRGAWIAWSISTLIMTASLNWRLMLKGLAGLLAMGLAAFAAFPQFRLRLMDIRMSRNEDRLELWRICYEMFKDAPIFGHGFYSFGSRYQKYTDMHLKREHFPVEAHNMYMDLLSGTGLFGILSFFYLLYSAFRLAISEFRKTTGEYKAWSLASIGILVSFVVAGIFDKQFYMTQTLVANLFFLSVLASHRLTLRNSEF